MGFCCSVNNNEYKRKRPTKSKYTLEGTNEKSENKENKLTHNTENNGEFLFENEILDIKINEKEKLEGLENEGIKKERLKEEKFEKDRLEKEELEKEKLEKEKLKEELEKERAEKEKLKEERLEKERLKEELEKERLEKEKLKEEKLKNEELEKERLEKEKLKEEKLKKEKLQKEIFERERLKEEILKKEELEKEKSEKERLKEELEKERLEKERLKEDKLKKEILEKERLEKEKLEKERLERERLEKEAKRRREIIEQLIPQSRNSTSEIDVGEKSTHDGGAIYDNTRKIILSVSGYFNNGRSIKVTRMKDNTHGTTEIYLNVIPFGTHGQYPVYDGTLYTYFFESESGSNNHFGRLKMDTLTFESLPSLPYSQFSEFSGGCFHNGKIYILNKELYLCQYTVENQSWNTLSLKLPTKGSLMNNPSDSINIYCIFEGQRFSYINLTTNTITDICTPPVKYSFSTNYEHYLFNTEDFGYFVFATFITHWYVYSSLNNKWYRLSNWKNIIDSSSHLVIIPDGPIAYYHVRDCSHWEMVPLQFLSTKSKS